jgi:hypothetical protein
VNYSSTVSETWAAAPSGGYTVTFKKPGPPWWFYVLAISQAFNMAADVALLVLR